MNFFSLSEKYFFITFVLQRNTEFAFLYLNELGVVKTSGFFMELRKFGNYGITESRNVPLYLLYPLYSLYSLYSLSSQLIAHSS